VTRKLRGTGLVWRVWDMADETRGVARMRRAINGATRLAGLIGWPIEHTLSPAIHNAAYEVLGLDWVYIPLPVADQMDVARVVAAARALPFVGFNVTMPYKRVMLELCDEVAAQARLSGAVNTVHVRDGALMGYNTDGRGLLEALRDEVGFTPEGRRIAVVGSGGAAAAVVAALVLERAAHITVISRDPEHAEDLVGRMRMHARDTEMEAMASGPDNASYVEAADVVVNATPLGMRPGDALPVRADWLHSGQVVSDMVYRPLTTPLLEAAKRAGARPVAGVGMLVAQAAIGMDIWKADSSVSAPRDVMRKAAEAAIESQGRDLAVAGEF
jgi:shikimate dehydrogenase